MHSDSLNSFNLIRSSLHERAPHTAETAEEEERRLNNLIVGYYL